MNTDREVPADPLRFIQECVRKRRIFWTYHVNLRLERRFIPRTEILDAVDSYEVVEAYPDDKYLPSYLILGRGPFARFHVLFATDVKEDNVRIVTAYRPNLEEWTPDLKTRRSGR